MSNIEDNELLCEFVAESRDHLSSIEPDLLTLEREGSAAGNELINRVFRAIHSIKGAAGFFGLERLKQLSHAMESVLMMVREGKQEPNVYVMDPLLAGVDLLNTMLENIDASEHVDCATVQQQLENILNGPAPLPQAAPVTSTGAIEAPQAAPPSEGDVAVATAAGFEAWQPRAEDLQQARANGQRLWLVTFDPKTDFAKKTPAQRLTQLAETGMVLQHRPAAPWGDAPQSDAAGGPWQVLIANVLSPDLLSLDLGLPAERIQPGPTELVSGTDAIPSLNVQPVSASEAPLPAQAEAAPEAHATPAPEASENLTRVEKPTLASAPAQAADKATGAVAGKNPTTSTSMAEESIRVRVDLLNKLMDLAGELVLARNQLLRKFEDVAKDSQAGNILQNVDFITADLQEHIMQTRMQPLGVLFSKFPRVVRDIAKQLGKNIQIHLAGEDVELDKTIVESLSDPLTHLIRNCCDHGIETPDVRAKAGKPEQGSVLLQAYHESGQINIAITDDGKGIDGNVIARKAVEKGLIAQADVDRLGPQERAQLIFLPGLSTAEKVSDLSGRGVGMDVVKTNIEKLGGTISLESTLGEGTTLILRLPLTLAIVPSLIIGVGGERFAMPQVNLEELVCVRASEINERIEQVGSAAVLRLRGRLLPLLKLSDVLHLVSEDRRRHIADQRLLATSDLPEAKEDDTFTVPDTPPPVNRRRTVQSDYNILVVRSGVHTFGLIAEQLFDTEEIVVKALSSYLKQCRCFSGATIMGDGRVAMILDVDGILKEAHFNFSDLEAEETRRQLQADNAGSGQGATGGQGKQSILLFNNSEDEIFALRLASVQRLEKFNIADIERVAGREFITYRGQGLPILRLENYLPVGPHPHDAMESFLIIPQAGHAGIMVSRILDTMEIGTALDQKTMQAPGLAGSAIINNHLTLFIDPEALLQMAGIPTGAALAAV
jgi:two-component system chemotaxis sensor kinase CheA